MTAKPRTPQHWSASSASSSRSPTGSACSGSWAAPRHDPRTSGCRTRSKRCGGSTATSPLGHTRGRDRVRAAVLAISTDVTAATPVPDVLQAQQRAQKAAAGHGARSTMPFSPQYGHHRLPAEQEADAAVAAVAPEVEPLIGTNRRPDRQRDRRGRRSRLHLDGLRPVDPCLAPVSAGQRLTAGPTDRGLPLRHGGLRRLLGPWRGLVARRRSGLKGPRCRWGRVRSPGTACRRACRDGGQQWRRRRPADRGLG